VLTASDNIFCDSAYIRLEGRQNFGLGFKIFTQFSVWWNEIYSSFVLSFVLLWGTPSR